MNTKRWLKYSAVIFIISTIIVLMLFKTFSLLSLLGGAVCSLITAAILLSLTNKWAKEEKPEQEEKVEELADQTEERKECLVRVNLLIRKDPLRDDKIVELVEEIIDQIFEVIDVLNKEYGGSELTYTVNKAVDSYLPDLLSKFLAINNPGIKAEKKSTVMSSLSGLKERIDKIVTMVDERAESQFDAEAKFLGKLMDPGSEEA